MQAYDLKLNLTATNKNWQCHLDLGGKSMCARGFLLLVTWGVAIALLEAGPSLGPAVAQDEAALTGRVLSEAEGAMEGVVVSARKVGSTVTVSVVTDQQGRFRFPAAKLEPGPYTLRTRAVGYDLDGSPQVDVAAESTATMDLKLRQTKDLAVQLTNAEWLQSLPGTEEQKSYPNFNV
jgi:virginiamycin B lyase